MRGVVRHSKIGHSTSGSLSGLPESGWCCRHSPNGRYRISVRISGSLRLDACELHHLAPLLGFVGDEFAEVRGRACKHSAPELDQPCPNLGVGEAGVDLLIELVDDLDRGPGGCSDPEPSARLVAWDEITDRR